MATNLKCFIEESDDSEFPIQNLPYGIFSTTADPMKRIGVAIGTNVLDLSKIKHLFNGPVMLQQTQVLDSTVLNDFMALGKPAWSEVRYLPCDSFSNLLLYIH